MVRARASWEMRACALVLAIAIGSTPSYVLAVSKRPLTVAESIETRRVLPLGSSTFLDEHGDVQEVRDAVSVSPDGTRYVVGLVRGDLLRNGVSLELISGRLSSLRDAKRFEVVARFFTSGLTKSSQLPQLTLPYSITKPLVWLPDSKSVALIWEDNARLRQVYSVDIESHRITQLTRHGSDVLSFAISPTEAIVYVARPAQPTDLTARSAQRLRDGFAVPQDADVGRLLQGHLDGVTASMEQELSAERFIYHGGTESPRRIATSMNGADLFVSLFETQFSPDGRYALIDVTPTAFPQEWGQYTNETMKAAVAEAWDDPKDSLARQLKQLYVVDLLQNTSRPLWNAPSWVSRAAWSPSGHSFLVGPAFLPVDGSDADGLAGKAISEVELASGAIRRIPLSNLMREWGPESLRWISDDVIEISAGGTRTRFGRDQGAWVSQRGAIKTSRRGIKIELRQDLNVPPSLVAVEEPSGKTELIMDLNPTLRDEIALGHVEHVTWRDKGADWSGLLYYPVGYRPTKRYPLVIQTHGHASVHEFSLYGMGAPAPGLGPSTSVYAAQALANRGIAVLQVQDKADASVTALGPPGEPATYMSAYEAVIQKLSESRLVDPNKVGLVGFSRTGWHVQYALTHSDFPYAAALTSDNYDAGYMQSVLFWTNEMADNIGALPFGDGLKLWLDRSPAFNADKIRTPLRLQKESGGLAGVLDSWEMFSRLRQLKKPVELYVIPQIDQGSHGIQNPAQCLASQQGSVDWFAFWLKNEERIEPIKNTPETKEFLAAQYRRWRILRGLQGEGEASNAPLKAAMGLNPSVEW